MYIQIILKKLSIIWCVGEGKPQHYSGYIYIYYVIIIIIYSKKY